MSDKIESGDSVTNDAKAQGEVLGTCDIVADAIPKESEQAEAGEDTPQVPTEDAEDADRSDYSEHIDQDSEDSEGGGPVCQCHPADPAEARGTWYMERGCGRIDVWDEYKVLNRLEDEDDVFLQNAIYLVKVWVRQLRESVGISLDYYDLDVRLREFSCSFGAALTRPVEFEDEEQERCEEEEMEAGDNAESGKKGLDEGAAETDAGWERENAKVGNEVLS